MASTADLAFHDTQVVTEMTNLGYINVALVTPTLARFGIQGDVPGGGGTVGLIFLAQTPLDAESRYNLIVAAGYHEDRGLIAGYERTP